MTKREADFQSVFNQYLRKKRMYGNFELKQTTGKSIRFDAVEPHQGVGLLAASAEGFVWKYSDQDQRQKPFDCSSIPPLPGYVVLRFPKHFYIIKIERFLLEKVESDRLSITEERSRALADWSVTL